MASHPLNRLLARHLTAIPGWSQLISRFLVLPMRRLGDVAFRKTSVGGVRRPVQLYFFAQIIK
jgi:hypothetical protein